MLYVLSHFWGWIFLAALGLGLIAGVLTWTRAQAGNWFSGWMTWSFIAFIVGALAVAFRLLEGRWNLYLETALAMFAAYIIGCLLGSWLHALFAAPAPSFATQTPTAVAAAVPAGSFAYPAAPANAPLEVDSSAGYPGKRPPGLAAAQGASDDLTRIRVIGAVDQKMLNDLGIFHNRQIALWTPENAKWVDYHMARPGRVDQEGWIRQAAAGIGAAGVSAAASAAPAVGASPAAASAVPVAASSGAPAAAVSVPAPAPRLADEDKHPGQRPPSFAQPRGGKADDLKRVRGIGRQNEERLNGVGVWHFDQIAAWSKAHVDWAGSYLAFPGRIEREEWVKQAGQLAQGAETEFSKRVAAGLVASSSATGVVAQGPAAGDASAAHPGTRPAGLMQARDGKPDDLKRISGVGPQNEQRLNKIGVWHYSQIAAWSESEIEWVSSFLAFPGRISREDWLGQAKKLALGLATDFAKRVDAGEVPSSSGELPKKG